MKAIGIVLAGGNNEMRMGELTSRRASAAMPVGSCYRAIDFALSNMSNSGIGKVAVITQYNSRSLHDHLSSAKWWDLGRKQGGLFVFTPFTSRDDSNWFRGTADSIHQNVSFLEKSNEKYVVITSGDSIFKMDFRDVLQYHVQKEADITIIYKNITDKDLSKMGVMELAEDGRVTGFEEKPVSPASSLASLGTYVISRELLIRLLNEAVPNGGYDFVKDIIISGIRELKVYGYGFDGYWSSIGAGIMEYFNTNMDFLKKDVRDVFTKEAPYISTKAKDEPPVKYNACAEAKNSICGGGTIIDGKVVNSVLFRRVYVGVNALVENCIIMEGSRIENNCIVKNAILDKYVTVTEGTTVSGEKDAPVIIGKNETV